MKRIEVKQETGFWDFDEFKDFVPVKSSVDGLVYYIYQPNTPPDVQLKLANILAQVRKDINTTLIYAFQHPELWINHKIAWGMYHAFDIHIPCWTYTLAKGITNQAIINQECIKRGCLFNYQEMPKNEHGILGLNKPKHIFAVELNVKGKKVKYELTDRRAIFLTLRDYRTNRIHSYNTIKKLFFHELAHTLCNDCRWKRDNHLPPFNNYATILNNIARQAGTL
jgi:hypothetical protein